MSGSKLIFGVLFLGSFLNGCGRQSNTQHSQLREVPLTEEMSKLPVGTVLKLKHELRLLPGATRIDLFEGEFFNLEHGRETMLRFDSSDRERVLKAGFTFVINGIANEGSSGRDYVAIHMANLSNTFKARILGLTGWTGQNGDYYRERAVCRISALRSIFDIAQPAPIVIGD